MSLDIVVKTITDLLGPSNFIQLMRSILLSFFVLASFFSYAQKKFTVDGYVRDIANGEAMIGATVYVQELKTGTITNEYGFYSVTIPAANYVLKFNYLSYVT